MNKQEQKLLKEIKIIKKYFFAYVFLISGI
jgi:hypothetical protein